MPNSEDGAIIIERQNFDAAMNSIKDFANQAAEHKPLDRVSHSGGFLGLGDHKVTGAELNRAVSQVEDQLMAFKENNLKFLGLITEIYNALDALDQNHISGILLAANMAVAASDKATENVKVIEKIVKTLAAFKEKLEKLEHLMDVDEVWELLDEQRELIRSLDSYQSELSKITHLQDVDQLWDRTSLHAMSLTDIENRLRQIDKTLEAQGTAISGFADMIHDISQNQQSFIDSANQRLTQYQKDTDRHLDERERDMRDAFTSFAEKFDQNQDSLSKRIDVSIQNQSDRMSQVEKAQTERLDAIQASQSAALTNIEKNQAAQLEQIKRAQIEQLDTIQAVQAENLRKISAAQSTALESIETTCNARLDQIAKTQIERLDAINQSLEEEKSALSEKAAALTLKIKIAYALAGGAALIAGIQLLLNITGVL